MSRFKSAGYYDTTAADGRAVRIVFPHDDRLREEEDIVDTVMVLREFAADCTAGRPPPWSASLQKRPESSSLNSDRLPRELEPESESYGAWFRTKNASTSKITSSKIVADVEAALQNDMRRPPTPPKQPSPPRQPSPPKQPSPPPSGAVGFMADGKTPVYWSKSQGKYYWQGPDNVKHGCAGPGSQFPSASQSSTAQASSSTATSSSSKRPQANASKPSSSSASSSNNPSPAGYTPNGIPYYYSATQKQFYTIGRNGKKTRYNP